MEQWDGNLWERISNHFEKDFYIKIPNKNGVYPKMAPVRKLTMMTVEDAIRLKDNLEREETIKFIMDPYQGSDQLKNINYGIYKDMSYVEHGLEITVYKCTNQWMLISSELSDDYDRGRVTHVTKLEWVKKNEKPRIRRIKLSDDWMNMRIYLTKFRENIFWANNNKEWNIGMTRYYYRRYLERDIMVAHQDFETADIAWEEDTETSEERL